MEVVDYTLLPLFDGLYLEDSWVTRIRVASDVVEFSVEFVLTETHPLYGPPLAGEQYCYRVGTLTFAEFTDMVFEPSRDVPGTDANGETDLDTIDSLSLSDNTYFLDGGWGSLRVIGPSVSLALVEKTLRPSGLDPADIVREFAALTAACLDQMRIDRETTPGGTILPDLPVRVGRVGTLGWYRRHGVGCRFELDSGEVLDVDWDKEGRAVFDTWRMRSFALSIGLDDMDQESLRKAAASEPLLQHVDDDWFTWRDSRFDIDRGIAN